MTEYRITKYNPSNRNEHGHYLDQKEWTSISDIGNPVYNSPSYGEYQRFESAYVEAILLVFKEKNENYLKVQNLQLFGIGKAEFEEFRKEGRLRDIDVEFKNDFETLRDGLFLSPLEIDRIARLVLREVCWLSLVGKSMQVKFGYDYYMYINCDSLEVETIKAIEKNGLYVEPNVGQVRYNDELKD